MRLRRRERRQRTEFHDSEFPSENINTSPPVISACLDPADEFREFVSELGVLGYLYADCMVQSTQSVRNVPGLMLVEPVYFLYVGIYTQSVECLEGVNIFFVH
ncbi:hypothetical protein Trydic_g12072 [Trypoxylus dichotomus]